MSSWIQSSSYSTQPKICVFLLYIQKLAFKGNIRWFQPACRSSRNLGGRHSHASMLWRSRQETLQPQISNIELSACCAIGTTFFDPNPSTGNQVQLHVPRLVTRLSTSGQKPVCVCLLRHFLHNTERSNWSFSFTWTYAVCTCLFLVVVRVARIKHEKNPFCGTDPCSDPWTQTD